MRIFLSFLSFSFLCPRPLSLPLPLPFHPAPNKKAKSLLSLLRPSLGISVSSLSPSSSSSSSSSSARDVVRVDEVSEPYENNPSVQAGVVEGDLITHLNDIRIESVDTFEAFVSQQEVGAEVRVRVLRGRDWRPESVAMEVGVDPILSHSFPLRRIRELREVGKGEGRGGGEEEEEKEDEKSFFSSIFLFFFFSCAECWVLV